jgi:hypothetical protein
MKQGHTFIYSLLKFEFFSSIHCIYIATKHETGLHMMENAICQHILPYYHSSIRSKKDFWRTSVWRRRRVPCARGRAAAAMEEEASAEAVAEETS